MLIRRTGAHNSAYCMPARCAYVSTKKTIRMMKLKSREILVPRIVPRWMRPMGRPSICVRLSRPRARGGKLDYVGASVGTAGRIPVLRGIDRRIGADPFVLVEVAVAGIEKLADGRAFEQCGAGEAGGDSDADVTAGDVPSQGAHLVGKAGGQQLDLVERRGVHQQDELVAAVAGE